MDGIAEHNYPDHNPSFPNMAEIFITRNSGSFAPVGTVAQVEYYRKTLTPAEVMENFQNSREWTNLKPKC